MTREFDALCCLITATNLSAVSEDPALEFGHLYPSVAGTVPYCGHDAVVGRVAEETTVDPSDPFAAPSEQRLDRVPFARFELLVVRCGPPSPDLQRDECLNDLYGSCSSPPSHSTIAGHAALVDAERDRLRRDLLDAWCDCLSGSLSNYSKTAPRAIESLTVDVEGRFAITRLIVAGLIR